MQNFIFDCKTRLIFGKGTEKTVGENMKRLGNKVLFHHYGEGYIKEMDLYIKPEENAVYYVINGSETGAVEFE